MKIVATYDFNGGKSAVLQRYAAEFAQIQSVISAIDASLYKTKESTEKTMMGKMLFSPTELNKAFKREFAKAENGGWSNHKVLCDYSYGEYSEDYIKSQNTMRFLKILKRFLISKKREPTIQSELFSLELAAAYWALVSQEL